MRIDVTPFSKVISEEITGKGFEGEDIYYLKRSKNLNARGLYVVKIHFLPLLSTSKQVNSPEQVPKGEKRKISIDCLIGFLSLAKSLLEGKLKMKDIVQGEDFYLYANTNIEFATYLQEHCGFRGTKGGIEVWVKKSEFVSEENTTHMLEFYQSLTQS